MTPSPSETSTLRSTRAVAQHVPAVTVLIACAIGIIADWYLSQNSDGRISWTCWMGSAGASACLWVMLFRTQRTRAAAVCLLTACALTGAAWHHARWSLIPSNALSAYATDQWRPVRLRAIVDSTPVVIPAEATTFPTARPKQARSLVELNVTALIAEGSQATTIPVTGKTRLDVQGALPTLSPGTAVEVWGLLSRPGPIRNPGSFDFKLYLRGRGIQTLVRCDFPDCVQVLALPPASWFPDFTSWQSVVAARLRRGLNPENAPLAIALLLGPRTDITQDLKAAFLQSGMMHFLAISGINVGILVIFLWPWTYLLPLPRQIRLLILGLCVAGYLLLTDADPPIVRAAILTWIMLLSVATGRPSAPLNHLAVAGLAILILNPHDLFQVGAQLSFLAIVALNWLWSIRLLVSPQETDALDELSRSRWATSLHQVIRYLRAGFITTTAVWIFTLPLVLSRFHLVSPAGFLLNIILSIWMTATLYAGYAHLACVLVFPPLGWMTGFVFDVGISVFSWVIRSAAALPWGHFKLSGPPDWWLGVFYLLILTIGSGLLSARWQVRGWRLILVWCVAGLAWGLPPASNPGLRCTFLAVGHGAAILIELPNRQTILYDAGSLEDGHRARQIVESAMLARGLTQIDALIISHADVDHFNAVPGLLDSFSVGAVYVSPAFLDFQQESVQQLCTETLESGVPLRLIWGTDRLRCDPQVDMEILLPPAIGFNNDDNANSLVLSLHYAGRGLLLTGDLENSGQQALLQLPSQPHDILLAPHHGSLKANPPDLARWAMPRWVVVSGGGHDTAAKLDQNYGAGAEVLTTSQRGAITMEISPRGDIQVGTLIHPAQNQEDH